MNFYMKYEHALFPKGEFNEELFEWVPFFVAIFKVLIGIFFVTPSTCGFILVGGGGGEAYFSKKTNLFDFDRLFSFLYISKQVDVLISDMDSKIVYGFFIKSSEQFLLFLFANKNIQLDYGFSVTHL